MLAGGKPELDLNTRIAKWRDKLDSGACGEMLIADEVIEVSRGWESPEKFSSFLMSQLGKTYPLKRFHQVADAVTHLGVVAKRTMATKAAVWLAGVCPVDRVQEVMSACAQHKRVKNAGNVLSIKMVERIGRKILGIKAKVRLVKPCERCLVLEGILRAHGIEMPPKELFVRVNESA